MAKPSSRIDWTLANPDQATISVEPTAQKKTAGWLPDERPPREYLNWLFQNVDEWIKYFETLTDELKTQLSEYDAVIGFGGTHADINSLMADPNIANLKNVLISGNLLVETTQIINQPGMNFIFKPSISMTAGAATIGLRIDAERVRILNARFVNFTGKAIELTVNAKNCILTNCMFKNNTYPPVDDTLGGVNNIQSNNLEEV